MKVTLTLRLMLLSYDFFAISVNVIEYSSNYSYGLEINSNRNCYDDNIYVFYPNVGKIHVSDELQSQDAQLLPSEFLVVFVFYKFKLTLSVRSATHTSFF